MLSCPFLKASAALSSWVKRRHHLGDYKQKNSYENQSSTDFATTNPRRTRSDEDTRHQRDCTRNKKQEADLSHDFTSSKVSSSSNQRTLKKRCRRRQQQQRQPAEHRLSRESSPNGLPSVTYCVCTRALEELRQIQEEKKQKTSSSPPYTTSVDKLLSRH